MAPKRQMRFHRFKHKVKIRGPGIAKTRNVEVRAFNQASFLKERQEGNEGDCATFATNRFETGPSNLGPSVSVEVHNDCHDSELPVLGPSLQEKCTLNKGRGSEPMSKYTKRKLREGKAWEEMREKLQSSFVQQQFLPQNTICKGCMESSSGSTDPRRAVCRCQDCGWQQFLCLECATELHSNSNVFHVLEIWKDGKFVPMFPNNFTIIAPGHESCGSYRDIKQIIFIDMQGRQHLKKMMFCTCQSEAEALVSIGFWPGTAEKPVTAFDMRLLNMLADLLFECHCSLDKLCATITLWKGPILPSYVTNIYKILNNASFDEYRFFRHSIGIQVENCTLCPKPNSNGTLIEVMDACFGFVRKKSAGCSLLPPKFGMCMFADQADVDNFIEDHTKETKKSENQCSQYRAGEITDCIRSKGRNERYDEKAVFGRICRHGFPKGFISLKHGERIAYAVYELKRMIEPFGNSQNVDIKCMYDIACILHKHLQNNDCYGLQEQLDKIQFGIPIFHAYVHIAKCQIAYSPRRVKGFGLTDGEGIERLWSFLRKFCYMTKEMTSSRRTDVLTEALLHYGRRINRNQGRYLANNLKKAKALKEKSSAELQEIIMHQPSNRSITPSLVSKWKLEEIRLVSSKRVPCHSTSSWETDYAQLLWDHYQLRNSIASSGINDKEGNSKELFSKVSKLDDKLKKIEAKNNISKRWKHSHPRFVASVRKIEIERRHSFLEKLHSLSVERHLQLMLKERYSTGQKQAVRLARLVNQQTKKIKLELARYNAQLSLVKEHVEVPQKPVTFNDAKDPNSEIYASFASVEATNEEIPLCVRRRIIELTELLMRCEEEESMLKAECKALLDAKIELLSMIKRKIDDLSDEADTFSHGLSAMLHNHLMHIEKEIITDKETYELFQLEMPTGIGPVECEYLASVKYQTLYDESDEESIAEYSDSDSEPECTFENDV